MIICGTIYCLAIPHIVILALVIWIIISEIQVGHLKNLIYKLNSLRVTVQLKQ